MSLNQQELIGQQYNNNSNVNNNNNNNNNVNNDFNNRNNETYFDSIRVENIPKEI